MLKVKLTENYTGITISGDYDDFDYLYDSFYYLIKGEPKSIEENTMQNHLYGFLYELRHAYQGQREAILNDNALCDSSRQWLKLKKKDVTDNNVYYCFNYILPDLLHDMVLIKYFIRNIDKKESDYYNQHINIVNFFYSLILNRLSEILTPIRFNKLKKGMLESVICDTVYCPQWFEMISCDYINSNKQKRVKNFINMAMAIYDFWDYDDYIEFKKEMEKICKEKNCTFDDFHYGNYPEEIEW